MNTTTHGSGATPWDTSSGNRFAHYSPTNHGATVWITTALALTYIVGVMLVRIFIKWRVFGWDDSLLVVGTLMGIIQCGVLFFALSSGLGKVPEEIIDIDLPGNLAFASRALFLVSHYLAKLSVLLLVRRLFVRDRTNAALLCNGAVAFTMLSGVVSVLVSTVKCPVLMFSAEHCAGQIARWSLITALDVVGEGVNLVLPSYMVWQVQMGVKTKLRVMFAFCSRLAVIALSAAHLHAWITYSEGEPSPFAIVPTLILQETTLAVSLISATVPNLKAFLQSLSAYWGEAVFGSGLTTEACGNGTFEMSAIHSHAPVTSKSDKNYLFPGANGLDFEIQVSSLRPHVGERSSLGSGGSQDLIIRKETAWTIEHH